MIQIRSIWERLKGSLWFVPSLMTAAAALLAFACVWLDRKLGPDMQGYWFLFGAGADGARGVLSTIAGSLITVTGVVFSITIVVLQLASSQFTPRVLRSFIEDRANQMVLGIFIGTFTYALLVLRTVRSVAEDYDRFVPALSVTVALVLAIVSIAFLIFFIHHIARSIRVEVILERVTRDALHIVDVLFPQELADPALEAPTTSPLRPAGPCHEVKARGGGYLQAIDDAALLRTCTGHATTIWLERKIGDFVVVNDVLARLWPPALAESTARSVSDAFTIGPERTRFQDVERGIIELADIGIRALSPGVNDPTTAIVCLDRLSEVLVALGRRRFPDPVRVDAASGITMITQAPQYEQLVRLAFRELRHHGAASPSVALRLITSLRRIIERVQPARHAALREEIEQVVIAAREALRNQHDAQLVEDAARARPL